VEQQDCGALPDLGGFVLFCSNLDLLQGIPATGVTLWSEGFGAEREGALLDCNRKCTDPARYPYDPAPRQMTHNDPSRAAGEVSSRASWVKCLLSKSAATGEYSAIQRQFVPRAACAHLQAVGSSATAGVSSLIFRIGCMSPMAPSLMSVKSVES
jgi:hypothetical protein